MLRDQSGEPESTPSTTGQSSSDRLRDLNTQYEEGLITEEEYQTKREDILRVM